jgi:hypothetical protein
MSTVLIDSITIYSDKGLLLGPASGNSYDLIYRAGNGLRWSREDASIVAHEPHRWEPIKLLKHILSTVESECGERFVLSTETQWRNIDLVTKAEIERIFKEANP